MPLMIRLHSALACKFISIVIKKIWGIFSPFIYSDGREMTGNEGSEEMGNDMLHIKVSVRHIDYATRQISMHPAIVPSIF